MTLVFPLLLFCWQTPGWDVRERAQKIASEIGELRPLVEAIRIERWTGPEAGRYENRKKLALDGVSAVKEAATALGANPEKLQPAVSLLAKLDGLLLDVSALAFGLARYQSGEMGEVASAAVERFRAHRDGLRAEIEQLAQSSETEMTVALKEAQRCRGQLARPAPARPPERK